MPMLTPIEQLGFPPRGIPPQNFTPAVSTVSAQPASQPLLTPNQQQALSPPNMRPPPNSNRPPMRPPRNAMRGGNGPRPNQEIGGPDEVFRLRKDVHTLREQLNNKDTEIRELRESEQRKQKQLEEKLKV